MSIMRNLSAVLDRTWPEYVDVYSPDVLGEISLPDYSSTLSCQTYMRMCGIPYMLQTRSNAEFMSPTGQVPVLNFGSAVMSDYDDIIEYVGLKGKGLTLDLEDESLAEMHAFMSMVHSVLGNAQMYVAWLDKSVSNEVTKLRYGSSYPWPLNRILPYIKQNQVYKMLDAQGWATLTEQQVCSRVEQCCEALSTKLGKKTYFFGDIVTPLDALVFGNLFAIVTTVLPNNCLSSVVKEFDNLQEFLRRVNETFFEGEAGTSPQVVPRTPDE